MPCIEYITKKFRPETLRIIEQANGIIAEYAAQGFDLTLRQLYYQFVSRDLLPNTTASYNRLGNIINDARLAGYVDWDTIVDRTREVEEPVTWNGVPNILSACAEQFKLDLWSGQDYRPEVWIEKEALKGVIENTCEDLRVPYFACKGYNSQSAMWRSARRMRELIGRGQQPVILHLGDHDSSGIDMTRDILDRMAMFVGHLHVVRLALNMEQVVEYGPPPNPAKMTDPRAKDYVAQFGDESWELDALEPKVINGLIADTVADFRDDVKFDKLKREEGKMRRQIELMTDNWTEIEELIEERWEEELDEYFGDIEDGGE